MCYFRAKVLVSNSYKYSDEIRYKLQTETNYSISDIKCYLRTPRPSVELIYQIKSEWYYVIPNYITCYRIKG